jgi:hypothetical protein
MITTNHNNFKPNENDNTEKVEILSPPENHRLTQPQHHTTKNSVGITIETPTTYPTHNQSHLTLSFSLLAPPLTSMLYQ